MKIRLNKVLTRTLCVVLSLIIATGFSLGVFAQAKSSEKTYVKDVKLIYAQTKDEAKPYVPAGYTLIDSNINKGTEDEEYGVYMAYSTTTNPDEAITDIKMMNMKGGFVLSEYENQLKDVKESVKRLADDVKLAVKMFTKNYVKGTYGAMAAYKALNAFTVDEANNQCLGDYLIYGNPTDEFYIKFVLNAHQNVLSAVLSALAMAVQGDPGNTWLDKLTKIENPGSIPEQSTYWDDSISLWEHFYSFYNVYKTIDHDLYKKGDPDLKKDPNNESSEAPSTDISEKAEQPELDSNGTEALYEIAYQTLDQYKFKSGEKISTWFLGDNVFEEGMELFENFYALLEVMTAEEFAMMRLCGPLYMILALGMNQSVYNDYVQRIAEVTNGETACSIWAGINSDLFRSSIGITDEAARAIAESDSAKELNDDSDSVSSTGLRTAGLIAACGAVSLGVGLISYIGFATPVMVSCFSGTALSAAASTVSIVGTIFGSAAMSTGIAVIVVAAVIAAVYLVLWIIENHNENHPDYTDIPEYMYDYVEDSSGNRQFLLYEGVKFQDDRMADVNCWQGKEWHAMYLSRDKSAGAPIEDSFIVKYGEGVVDEGYAPLSNFGHINVENLNHYDFEDNVDGVYVSFRQEKLNGDYARGTYLSNVKLFSNTDADLCELELRNQDYIPYKVNLTPDSEYVTYLGYKTTNKESRALTDIRVAYNYSTTQYAAGGAKASYAASGSTGDGMITLYATKISAFGTPILSDFLVLNDRNAPAGYEPVNFFSGGPAISFNTNDNKYMGETKPFYLYFLPSVTYTSGTEYLGGLATVFDIPGTQSTNDLGSISRAIDTLGYNILYETFGPSGNEGALLYTTTHNPYRAIYNITAVSADNDMGKNFAQTISYDNVGYSLAARYLISHQERVAYEYAERRANDSRLYTAGIYESGTPMRVSDLYVSSDQNVAPAEFIPVYSRLSGNTKAVDIAKAFNLSIKTGDSFNGMVEYTDIVISPFYLFIKKDAYVEGNHLTHIFLTSKEEVINGAEIDCDDLDNSYIMNTLAAMGAHNAILKNLNLEDGDNATYLGYTKMAKNNAVGLLEPITNLVLYYIKDTNITPKSEIVLDGITYHIVSKQNIFCEEDGANDTCDRVYLYYTTNPAAGSPIIDITIDNTHILNGWETVRTQNSKALYADMDDHSSSMWFIHMKRTPEEPKYIDEIVVGVGGNDAEARAALIAAGCEYMLEKDFNNNVGIHSDYIYIGYKRTSDPAKAIRDLKTTHNNEVDSFAQNGSTYLKIDGNLNSYTYFFSDDIFLYYTKDAKAGTPITSLGTSKHVANWSHGEGGRYVVRTVLNQNGEASDLNDGAGGDYIYLLQTRDKTDENGTASMIGAGSIALIAVFAVVSLGAIATILLIQRKRCIKTSADTQKHI